jgi:hypothetical protein
METISFDSAGAARRDYGDYHMCMLRDSQGNTWWQVYHNDHYDMLSQHDTRQQAREAIRRYQQGDARRARQRNTPTLDCQSVMARGTRKDK